MSNLLRKTPRAVLGLVLFGALLGLGALPPPGAADEAATSLDGAARRIDGSAPPPAGQTRVAGRIAEELNATWGLAPRPYSTASVTRQRTRNGWGWGEVVIANRLAQELARTLLAANPTLSTAQAFRQATAQITAARQQGMGWGAIANANGMKVGAVLRDVEHTAKALDAVEKGGKAVDQGGSDKSGGKGGVSAEQGPDKSASAAADHGGQGGGNAGGGRGGGDAAGGGPGAGGGGQGGGSGSGGGGGGGGGAGGGGGGGKGK
jgi:hypothetical protein